MMLKQEYLDAYNNFIDMFQLNDSYDFQGVTIYKNPDSKICARIDGEYVRETKNLPKELRSKFSFLGADDVFGNHYIWKNTVSEKEVREFLEGKCENMLVPKKGDDISEEWDSKVEEFKNLPRWTIAEDGQGLETMFAKMSGWISLSKTSGEWELYIGDMEDYEGRFKTLEKAFERYSELSGISPIAPFNQYILARRDFNHILSASVYVPDALEAQGKAIHLRDNGAPSDFGITKNSCLSCAVGIERTLSSYSCTPKKSKEFTREYATDAIVNQMYLFYKEGLIDRPFYSNATSPMNLDSFIDVVLPHIDLSHKIALSRVAVDERLEKFTGEELLRDCVTEYLCQNESCMFLYEDASLLLNPDNREEMDFAELVDDSLEDFVFAIDRTDNGFLHVDNVFENTDDEIAFLLPSLKKIMELTYDMQVSLALDIDRISQDMKAELKIVVDYQSNNSPVVSVPITLTNSEKDTLTAIVEAQIGEPVKITETDLKKNSTLKVKHKVDKEKEESLSVNREKTKDAVSKDKKEKTEKGR